MGGDAAKARKVAALQNEVAALQAAQEAAQHEYQRVKGRNLQVRAFTQDGARGTAGMGRRACALMGRLVGRRLGRALPGCSLRLKEARLSHVDACR